MTDKINKDADSQDSLVDALESIKSLLAKSDSKLAAARESIAIASNQTAKGQSEQFEIPVLNDIVTNEDVELATKQVSNISEELSSKIDETLAAVHENIPTLSAPVSAPNTAVLLDYLDTLQEKLEKSLRDSLMKSIVTIESGLKKSLVGEIDKIRDQIKKDFD